MRAAADPQAPRRVLVTGGVRSGKSRHAEALLAADETVLYVAPGPTPDAEQDPDWRARVEAHRARRPQTWQTLEGRDLAGALTGHGGAVLVDCLGTWLTALLDDHGAWESDTDDLAALLDPEVERLGTALRRHEGRVVLVTNEVGMGVVPGFRSGRVFRDLLGMVNQRVGTACDEVHLVVAGRVLVL